MPVTFIRSDITKLNTDAIVNAANNELRGGGGVDGAIHAAAGDELYAYCKTLGGCPTGEARVSPGFHLPAKYIIHTVGPVWRGGAFHEKTLLTSCYLRSLELARQHKCKTVAFPLISAGAYGYPYDAALQIAYDTCQRFLQETKADMEIFIVLYQGKRSLNTNRHRTTHFERFDDSDFLRVARYIRDNYHFSAEEPESEETSLAEDSVLKSAEKTLEIAPRSKTRFQMAGKPLAEKHEMKSAAAGAKKQSLFDRIFSAKTRPEAPPPTDERTANRNSPFSGKLNVKDFPVEETFTQMLLRFMREKNMSAPELYTEACLDRKLFSKIQSNPDYQPKKYTAVRLALALQLSPAETDALLNTAGYALSRSKIPDLVISYCITNNKRSVWEVNGMLEDWGLSTI